MICCKKRLVVGPPWAGHFYTFPPVFPSLYFPYNSTYTYVRTGVIMVVSWTANLQSTTYKDHESDHRGTRIISPVRR